MDQNYLRYIQARSGSFNPYAAGNKQYAQGAPNVGPVSTQGQMGYAARDANGKAMRNAMLRRMKAGQRGALINPDYLMGQVYG